MQKSPFWKPRELILSQKRDFLLIKNEIKGQEIENKSQKRKNKGSYILGGENGSNPI
jgi:hypothetical protein